MFGAIKHLALKKKCIKYTLKALCKNFKVVQKNSLLFKKETHLFESIHLKNALSPFFFIDLYLNLLWISNSFISSSSVTTTSAMGIKYFHFHKKTLWHKGHRNLIDICLEHATTKLRSKHLDDLVGWPGINFRIKLVPPGVDDGLHKQ